MPWLLPALNLLSLAVGSTGGILLAFAIGDPSRGQDQSQRITVLTPMGERDFPMAVVQSARAWAWGVRLIALAFLFQLPGAIVQLTEAF